MELSFGRSVCGDAWVGLVWSVMVETAACDYARISYDFEFVSVAAGGHETSCKLLLSVCVICGVSALGEFSFLDGAAVCVVPNSDMLTEWVVVDLDAVISVVWADVECRPGIAASSLVPDCNSPSSVSGVLYDRTSVCPVDAGSVIWSYVPLSDGGMARSLFWLASMSVNLTGAK